MDNAGAFSLVINEVRNLNERTKHIDIKHHFIREKVIDEKIRVVQILSEENVADVLTKPLARSAFERMRKALRVYSASD